ncbi:MAG: NUDIX domain-containing protein [Eggerthellaceae bacterium]|jgi:ADP-ribose pyrophosphatase
MDQPKAPELLSIEQVSDGWLKKYILHYRLPNGREKTYESVSRKDLAKFEAEMRRPEGTQPTADAVSIVATTDSDEVLLIKEFRYPMNSWCVALPAGLIDPGEDIATAVERELREETGYAIERRADGTPKLIALPQKSYSSEGMTEECLSIVRVKAYPAGAQETEPSEFIEVFPLKVTDIPRFLEENTLPMSSRAQLVLESYADRIGPGSDACFD